MTETVSTIVKSHVLPDQGWSPTVVTPSHVNLAPMEPVTLGDFLDHVEDTTSLAHPSFLERYMESVTSHTFALKKDRSVYETDNIVAAHGMTVEIGLKYANLQTGEEEYYIEYNYRTFSGSEVKVNVSLSLINRDWSKEQSSPYDISVHVVVKNPDLPYYPGVTLSGSSETIKINEASYEFDMTGKYIGLCANAEERSELDDDKKKGETLIVLSSHVDNEEFALFKSLFSGVDISVQRLDGLQTLHNLFENINSDTPQNPLSCIRFIDAETQ